MLLFQWAPSSVQVFEIFDAKQNSVIEFGEFVRSLSAFHPNAPLQDKADCTCVAYNSACFLARVLARMWH